MRATAESWTIKRPEGGSEEPPRVANVLQAAPAVRERTPEFFGVDSASVPRRFADVIHQESSLVWPDPYGGDSQKGRGRDDHQ